MAIKRTTKKSRTKTKSKRKPNWLLRFTLAVIIVPCIILAWVLLTSIENTGEPITGDRFESQLNPAISKEQVKAVKDALAHDQIQNIEVNLKSATLRITIDVVDELDQATMEQIREDIFGRVAAILPMETYFTNTEKMKMYDFELHMYNFITQDPAVVTDVYLIRTKTGAGGVVDDLVSSPKNPEVSGEILK